MHSLSTPCASKGFSSRNVSSNDQLNNKKGMVAWALAKLVDPQIYLTVKTILTCLKGLGLAKGRD